MGNLIRCNAQESCQALLARGRGARRGRRVLRISKNNISKCLLPMLRFTALAVLAFLLPQAGCPMIDEKIMERVRPLFPGASVSHPRRDALVIDTNISGEISPELCRQLFNSFASTPQFKDLEWGFAIAQYSMLGIALSDNVIIWDKSKKDYFWVLKRQNLGTLDIVQDFAFSH